MALGITGKAARMVIEFTQDDVAELGDDYMPAIAWITGDTNPQAPVPRLAVGVGEKKQLEGRLLECEEFDCKIGQVLPDEILQSYASYQIDVGDEGLTFVRKG